jgi:hypothetical protein
MIMRTLELKDICGYLPHRLNIVKDNDIAVVETVSTSKGLAFGVGRYSWLHNSEGYKPILRPLSDLYRPVTHNGKEIVPIVECAKIAFGDYGFYLTEVIDNDSTNMYYASAKFKGEDVSLFYGHEIGFDQNYNDNIMCNQYKLFDFLHELKIDYRGLIDAGLAVDCNTLEVNPYK